MTRPYRNRKAYHKTYRLTHQAEAREYRKANKAELTVIGIDGEGVTVGGRHLYTYLAAYTETECVSELSDSNGIQPRDVCEFLLSIKRLIPDSLLVGFALGYDYTKWFEALPTEAVYKLARPETRHGKLAPYPVCWQGYALNYLRGKFSVQRVTKGVHWKACKNARCTGCERSGESVSVWDVFGFFQGSFINACKAWGITSEAEYTYLQGMKARRSEFTQAQWDEVKQYCGVECRKLASLVTALRRAHTDAEIPLSSYYGAGSTASAVLKGWNVKAHYPPADLPEGLRDATARAFFGGRFEIERFGPVAENLYSYDIASAYPYQLTGLPCLACGRWEHVTGKSLAGRIERANMALVRYSLPHCAAVAVNRRTHTSEQAWGPFPLRTSGMSNVGPLGLGIDDGSIVYPATSGGGWTYRDEYLEACAGWPNVKAHEAWVYDTDCSHEPFKGVADLYCKRLAWGKEGRGIVVKLGANSIYGKLAQSIGRKPPYQCYQYAGAITSGTRAQLLGLIAQAPESALMVATDGLVSRVPLLLPTPRYTGTREAADRAGKVELGAWEAKDIVGGMHLIRPGIAFPLVGATEASTKARGIGKAVLRSHRELVLEHWNQHGPKALELTSATFHGMKSATSIDATGYKRADNYGQWSERPQSVGYFPEPKRPMAYREAGGLCTWAFGKSVVSAPYDRALPNSTAAALAAKKVLESEQPDGTDTMTDEF